ncbi:MAG TPA: COR domain-containing protein [Planctomycetaceae bacterium]|jgi:internalin A|nr:COR domain-containing protein [Planctomycetaceae bacterium]
MALELKTVGELIEQARKTHTLRLAGRKLSSLPEEIAYLEELTSLDISNNKFTELPAVIWKLRKLTMLVASDNRLRELTSEIANLTHLTRLELDNNQLIHVPNGIAALPELAHLSLASNKLSALPTDMPPLRGLRSLNIRNNHFDDFSALFAHLPAIEQLEIAGNPITQIDLTRCGLRRFPPGITQLTHLETLRLDDNSLTTLPEEIKELGALSSLTLSNNDLTTVPASLASLTLLTELNLSGNRITYLPESLADATHVVHLDLESNRLGLLPSNIERIKSLRSLNLADNNLDAIPAGILALTSLTHLSLRHNKIRQVQRDIQGLEKLESLNLADNDLTEFPVTLLKMSRLAAVNLSGNPFHFIDLRSHHLRALPPMVLTASHVDTLLLDDNLLETLPAGIADLCTLKHLSLAANRLTSLPPELGRLSQLEVLSLERNDLTELPAALASLNSLLEVRLDGNTLPELPPVVCDLRSLHTLRLSHTSLSQLPADLRNLHQLRELRIDNNSLNTLPSQIGQLRKLTTLHAMNNRLTSLPGELGHLAALQELRLEGNPLVEPLPQLLERGVDAIRNYLSSLETGIPTFEAKVLLVGEGNVGKSSLFDALQRKPFIDGRPTTHGINIGHLALDHPTFQGVTLSLNVWDFGGQEVYRITHQFFYSTRSLYLVVWNARDGQERDGVAEWVRRIRLRVREGVKVMVVATHGDERNAEVDLPLLKARFGDMVVGAWEVDSKSSKGIQQLKEAIGQHAAMLPQMGEIIAQEWATAGDNIRALDAPVVDYATVENTCLSAGVARDAVRTLIQLLHDVGHLVYYNDDGLRDVVVLRPQWLTRAIGYVLEDRPTRDAKGLLDHKRLRAIWETHGRSDRDIYPQSYHPYFLRLMEKYDICFRLSDDTDKSLVGQLVPQDPPLLPWTPGTPCRPGEHELSVICSMDESPPPGLVAWLTVRNHRFSAGLHWGRGTFLRSKEHEAYVALSFQNKLWLVVRGGAPHHFMALLRDSVEYLIELRWPGLRYEFQIPCSSRRPDGSRCDAQFAFKEVYECLVQGPASFLCLRCRQMKSVADLLVGLGPAAGSFGEQFEQVLKELRESTALIRQDIRSLSTVACESSERIRQLLRAVSTETQYCPRVFVLVPVDRSSWKPASWVALMMGVVEYEVTLVCEHPGDEHLCEKATYKIAKTRDWLKKCGPWIGLVTQLLKATVPVMKVALGFVTESVQNELKKRVDVMDNIARALQDMPKGKNVEIGHGGNRLSEAEGAALREMRELLRTLDPNSRWGGLTRVLTASGDYLWVCEDHYKEYDPGLPQLPQQGSSGSTLIGTTKS